MSDVGTALVRYDAMCRAIAAAHAVDEVKDIRDRAVAMEAYFRQTQNVEAELQARRIRERAEHKGGELLRRLFPVITNTAQARACARTIAG